MKYKVDTEKCSTGHSSQNFTKYMITPPHLPKVFLGQVKHFSATSHI